MSQIVLISGSPSADSSSDIVLDFVGSLIKNQGHDVEKITVTDMPAEDLVYGRYDGEAIQAVTKKIEAADGIVIASPVYKAAYTGVLKALLDILPQDVFQSKVVLPIMVGGSYKHLLAIEYTLKPVIAILKGNSLNGVYIVDNQVDKNSKNPIINKDIDNRIIKQLEDFEEALQEIDVSLSK